MDDARALKQASLVFLGLALALCLARVVSDLHRSYERARLVRSLVREHNRAIAAADLRESATELRKPWPNDFLMLEGWLAVQVARDKSPSEISRSLRELRRQQPALSVEMAAALERWKRGLERWTREGLPADNPREELQRGRQRFLEAQGYSGIGRGYDAAVLYLWAAHALTRAIEIGKTDKDFPEALYLLGVIYLTLRHSLPGVFRGERLLNVCSDLYPSSIWASRANAARHMGIR